MVINKFYTVLMVILLSSNSWIHSKQDDSNLISVGLNTNGHIKIEMNDNPPFLRSLLPQNERNIIEKLFSFERDHNNWYPPERDQNKWYLIVKELTMTEFNDLKKNLKQITSRTTRIIGYFSRVTSLNSNDYLEELIEEICIPYKASQKQAKEGLFKKEEIDNPTNKIITINLNNPDNDADISEFILWYRGLLDLIDEVNKRFKITIKLKDLWSSSIVAAAKNISSLALSFGALALSRYFYKTRGVPVGDTDIYSDDDRILIGALAGGSLGLGTSAWRHWGRRTTMKRRLLSMGLLGGFGYLSGGVVGLITLNQINTYLSSNKNAIKDIFDSSHSRQDFDRGVEKLADSLGLTGEFKDEFISRSIRSFEFLYNRSNLGYFSFSGFGLKGIAKYIEQGRTGISPEDKNKILTDYLHYKKIFEPEQ